MSKNSLWFPRLSSWISAFLLLMLTGLVSSSIQRMGSLELILGEYPRLLFALMLFGVLSPIWLVAYIHHLIQLILNRLDPEGAPDQQLTGFGAFFPMVMSWWEGLYAWLVLLLSTIFTIGFLGMVIPWHDLDATWQYAGKLYDMLLDVNKLKYLFSPVTIIWVIFAGYLYQFEHVVMLRGRKV